MNTFREKQTAHIEDWVVHGTDPDSYMKGAISMHSRQHEFQASRQHTSRLISIDPVIGVAETQNTVYSLGKPFEYAPIPDTVIQGIVAFMKEKGMTPVEKDPA